MKKKKSHKTTEIIVIKFQIGPASTIIQSYGGKVANIGK